MPHSPPTGETDSFSALEEHQARRKPHGPTVTMGKVLGWGMGHGSGEASQRRVPEHRRRWSGRVNRRKERLLLPLKSPPPGSPP